MRKQYTIAEAKTANDQCEKLEAAYTAAYTELVVIIGDNQHPNGLVFEETRISAPYRAAKAKMESAMRYQASFNKAAGKELLGAMAYVRNPARYPECKKYIKEG